jgi:DNA-binding transcriptional ArsR family regulator
MGRTHSPSDFRRQFISIDISNLLYKILIMSNRLSLDVTFSALADPTRRAILARLAKGEATVNQLAAPFEMSQPAISQHLKVLEEAGLIERRVEGARRPRRLAKDGIAAMDQWLDMLRTALEKNYDRLDQILANPHSASMDSPQKLTTQKLKARKRGETNEQTDVKN